MADTKISALTDGNPAESGDQIPINRVATNFKITAGSIAALGGGAPAAHATSHQNGGTDEISVLGLSGLLADGQTPLAHATSHQNAGTDEISVIGLSGLLADGQTPLAHKTSHQDGGTDEVSVTGLSGLLADAQKVTVRKDGGADVGPRARLNFIEGINTTITAADDAGGAEVDITLAAPNAQWPILSGVHVTPADGVTYYFGGAIFTPTVAPTIASIYARRACTVRAVRINVHALGALATNNESSTLNLRLNNTTDTELSTVVKHTLIWQTYLFTGLSIAVGAGEFVEFKIVHPTWTTNPTNVTYSGWIEVEE